MDKLTIKGIDGYEGDYDVELSQLTNRELHQIRLVSGIRARELADAAIYMDTGFLVGLASVVLARYGKPVIENVLWDSELGSLKFAFGEGDAAPPSLTPEDAARSGSGDGETTSSSGPTGETDSETPSPTTLPDRSGDLGSEIDAA